MAQPINEQVQQEAVSSEVPQLGQGMDKPPHSNQKMEVDVAPPRIDKQRRESCNPLLVFFSSLASLFAGMISVSATAGQGMSKFYWHIPVLYGDKTAREWPEITGFRSGCVAGGKSLLYGFYDGVTGVVTLPYKGARGAGIKGFGIGILHGIGGLFFKPLSGIWAFIGHPIFGLHRYMDNRKQRHQQQDPSSLA